MAIALTVNELTNLVCDVFHDMDMDYDFEEIESTVNGLDEDIFDDLRDAAERGAIVEIKSIVED